MLRLRNLNPYEQHKLIINEYILNQPGATKLLKRDTSRDKRDIDVIRENHKFLWDDEDIAEATETWEKQLARKYYDKLFKEYCITDLCRYKENKIALRWRVEKEVISGKGQFICGNKICTETEGLRSWEVNFAYKEQGERKNALVKLRLCPDCSIKLNYHSKKREVKRTKKALKKQYKKELKTKSNKKDSTTIGDNGNPSSSNYEEVNAEKDDKEDSTPERIDESEMANSDDENARQVQLEQQIEKEAHNVWANQKIEEEPTREEEFERYLEDLLL